MLALGLTLVRMQRVQKPMMLPLSLLLAGLQFLLYLLRDIPLPGLGLLVIELGSLPH